jgi:hypothetical protein
MITMPPGRRFLLDIGPEKLIAATTPLLRKSATKVGGFH